MHHFDLLECIKEVELLAKSTKSNIKKSVRKLNIRKKYEDGDIPASIDEAVWQYQVKYQISSLKNSMTRCGEITKILLKLQKDCSKT